MEGLITLRVNEWDRVKIIQRVVEEGCAQAEAAERLAVSLGHFRRLLQGYRKQGTDGFDIPKARPPSSRKI